MSSFWGAACSLFDTNLPGATDGNLHSAEYFGAAMGGLIAIFTALHWLRYPYAKTSQRARIARTVSSPFELLRGFALRKVPLFTSAGHAMVVFIYIGVNVLLLFTMLDWPLPLLSDFGRRLGWVCVANIAFIFFLALKNTPLAFLTEYSYERLLVSHQIAGYTTILLAVLHTVVFIVARAQENIICNILDIPQHPGMVATGAMLIILVTALFMKGWKYEAFYVIHVIMAVLTLFGVGLHRPDFGTYSVQAIIFTAAIFIADRIFRGIRLLVNKRQQTATLTPLVGGGTMIELSRPVSRAVAGKHVLLMINKIKFLQSHPFTMVSANPVKFIVDTHNGFTQKLYERALKEPGVTLKATVDGPYGTLPAFHKYNKIILIAGGTGASFTLGIAIELLKRLKPEDNIVIEFVWTVRDHAKLEWFAAEIQTITASPLITIHLYTTAHTHSPVLATAEKLTNQDLEMGVVDRALVTPGQEGKPTVVLGQNLLQGRPDVSSIIGEVVRNSTREERIVIAACGPRGLMDVTRNSVAGCVRIGGPAVELHVESFEW